MIKKFIPSDHQSPLDLNSLIVPKPQGEEDVVKIDVLFVGGGPSGLASAIKLAQQIREDSELKDLEIAVLDKAGSFGEHSLSGAVLNPMAFYELFGKDQTFPFKGQVKKEKVYFLTKKKAFPIPTPPPMHNKGFFLASLSECVRWMSQKAENLGIHLFNNFPAESLLIEKGEIVGVKTTASGLNKKGEPTAQHTPSTYITSKITVLAEGSRGLLTQGYRAWQNITSPCPQVYALGVKEIWRTKDTLPFVAHTLGHPLSTENFGGSFMYPMGENMLALGLVAGLDHSKGSQDIHFLLQKMKQHPFFQKYLKGGEPVEWGAKTIPEGGYQSLPSRFSGKKVLMIGDCVGLVNVPSLKGIHYSMMSGIYAAETLYQAFKEKDLSDTKLKTYDETLKKSFIFKDLYKVRNMKPSFKGGLFKGTLKAGFHFLSKGKLGGNLKFKADSEVPRFLQITETLPPLGFSKVNAVYLSGNKTRDDIPSHLKIGKNINKEVAEFYTRLCPAGVYERNGDNLIVNAPNCVDCKATDVLGPRWKPREGGSGPHYKNM